MENVAELLVNVQTVDTRCSFSDFCFECLGMRLAIMQWRDDLITLPS